MTTAAVARLWRCAQALSRGEAPDAADAAALGEGLALYLDGGEDLDVALGVRALPGERAWQTRAAIDERDRLLRAAAERFFPGRPWAQQAERLHEALGRYRAGAWRRERALAVCPERWSGRLQAELWRVLRARDHVPSARTIRLVLARSSPMRCQGAASRCPDNPD